MTRWLPIFALVGCGSITPAGGPATPVTGSGATATGGTATGGTGTGTATGGTATGTGTGGCEPIGEEIDAGNTCALALDKLPDIDDSGGPVQIIEGNIHEAGDVDWYVINAIDTSGDEARGYEDFHLEVRVSTGSEAVQVHVLAGNCGGAAQVGSDPGFDEWEFFSEDLDPDDLGSVPADFRACGAPGGVLNECTDYTGPYLVRVSAIDGGVVCDPYVLDVSNGVW